MRPRTRTAPAYVALVFFASGCSSSGPDPEAVAGQNTVAATQQDADAGLPTKGEADAGVGTKDSGLGFKDAGVGTKDGGLGTEDAGPASDGAATPGTPDAGTMNECFACAQTKCAVAVNACVHSPGCVEEGDCDLMCLSASAGRTWGPDPACVLACTKDRQATERLLAAVTCGFWACPVECLHPLISCGGDAGAFGRPVAEDPGGEPGCRERLSGSILH